jgi:hypothetical protein
MDVSRLTNELSNRTQYIYSNFKLCPKKKQEYLMRALGMDAPVLRRFIWNMLVDVLITGVVQELRTYATGTR